MDKEQKSAMVIDIGSGLSKAGIAGEDAPCVVFPSIVGMPKQQSIHAGMGKDDIFFGEQAQGMKNALSLRYPVKHGTIIDWENVEKVWRHCFNNYQPKTQPTQQPCLMSESPLQPKANRQKSAQIMFQQLNVPAFFLSIQAVLALYCSGRTTGLVLDSGHGVTHVVPIYEGYALPNSIMKNNISGADLNVFLKQLLTKSNPNFTSVPGYDVVKKIKQKDCYVAYDYDEEMKNYGIKKQNNSYELPDGQALTIGAQKFKCPEILFTPKLNNQQLPGIHELVFQSIMKSDPDIRRDYFCNIVLSGGNTMFPGIQERLNREVIGLAAPGFKIKVITPLQRNYAAWIGGSILASLSTFKQQWVTKAQYDETGPVIIHQKCI